MTIVEAFATGIKIFD